MGPVTKTRPSRSDRLVDLEPVEGWCPDGFTGCQVERCVMPGAMHLAVDAQTITERASVVAAVPGDGAQTALGADHDDLLPVDLPLDRDVVVERIEGDAFVDQVWPGHLRL